MGYTSITPGEWLNGENAILSSDGNFIAYSRPDYEDIWLYSVNFGGAMPIPLPGGWKRIDHVDVSADGRFVTYVAAGTNLPDTVYYPQLFLHDRYTGITETVSVSTGGVAGNGASFTSRVSADGRFVAFDGYCELVAGDTNRSGDLYLRDRENGTTIRIDAAPEPSGELHNYYGAVRLLDMTDDASHIFYQKVDSDPHSSWLVRWYVYDRDSGASTLVSEGQRGVGAMSADGSVVVIGRELGGVQILNNATGQTVLIDGFHRIADVKIHNVSMSADGRYVAFTTRDAYVADDTNYSEDVYVYDTQSAQLRRVSVTDDGGQVDGSNFGVSISADGRSISFVSTSTYYDPGEYYRGTPDVVLVDNPLFDTSAEDPNIYGTPQNDILTGRARADIIHALAGDDLVNAGAGADTVYGGDGADTLHGDLGDDLVFGDAGDDALYGGAGHNELHGGDGSDELHAGDSGDKLFGEAGSDHFWGGMGDETIDGGTDADRADIDVLHLAGSADNYWIEDVPTQGGTPAHTVIASWFSGQDVVKNVELAQFDHLRTNEATVDNLYVTLAEAADIAYSNSDRMGHGWQSLTAMELGLRPLGDIEGIQTSYTFANGLYSAQAPAPVGGDTIEAAAHVYFGVVDGKNTLMLAFRGTDTIDTDGQDYPAVQLHYQRFEPLVKAVLDYVNTGGHVEGASIDQVFVAGHSLGGAMAQMFMQDARVYGDPRFTAATFGSPGAENHAFDSRILHFEHSADPVPLAADIARYVHDGFDNSVFGEWDRLLGGAVGDFLKNQPDPTDFRTAGGVVRLSTDDSVGLGLPQHSMTNYVNSLVNLAQHTDLFPFMTQGYAGMPPSGHLDLAVGSNYAESIHGSDPFFVRSLRGDAYFDGSETIVGGAGADTLGGGAGQDLFVGTLAELDGDTILDMAGGERIRVMGADLFQGDIAYAPDGLGLSGGMLTIGGQTAINIAGFHPGTFTIVRGEGYADIVYTGALSLSGSDAADRLGGGEGDDELSGGGGDDLLTGGAGSDRLLGGAGADRLMGDGTGSGAGLRITAQAASGADDLLDGGLGADTLTGGAGRDTFVLGTDAVDTITDFSSGDLIDVSALPPVLSAVPADGNPFAGGYLRLESRGADTALVLDTDGMAGAQAGRDVALLKNVAPAVLTPASFVGTGDAVLDPSRTAAPRLGTTRSEAMTGTAAGDTLYGQAGADVLRGGAGNDELDGGADNDALYGEAGDDLLKGGLGNDQMDGGDGADDLRGGQGNDILRGGSGDDRLLGGAGDDQLYGGLGSDRFVASLDGSKDVIRDFQAGAGDRLDLSAMLDVHSLAELGSRLHANGMGDAVVELGGGASVTLFGVAVGSLSADHFLFAASYETSPIANSELLIA